MAKDTPRFDQDRDSMIIVRGDGSFETLLPPALADGNLVEHGSGDEAALLCVYLLAAGQDVRDMVRGHMIAAVDRLGASIPADEN